MERWKRRWKKVPTAVRKPLILVIGTAIVVLGLALIPLPGPGWAIVFGGFALLATEFAFAEKLRAWSVKQVKSAVRKLKDSWKTHHKA